MNLHIDLAKLHIADLVAEADRERRASLARRGRDEPGPRPMLGGLRPAAIAAAITIAAVLLDRIGTTAA